MVNASQRYESTFKVAVDARKMSAYTLRILSNPKNFPPDVAPTLLDELNRTAIKIFANVKIANDTDLFRSKAQREQYQQKAYALCVQMMVLIELAKPVYSISAKRLRYWARLVIDLRNSIIKWIQSDNKRFKEHAK